MTKTRNTSEINSVVIHGMTAIDSTRYHYSILKDGSVKELLSLENISIYNSSIEIVMEAFKDRDGNVYTEKQFEALSVLLVDLSIVIGPSKVEIYGHDELSDERGNPGFNVAALTSMGLVLRTKGN